MKTTKVMSLWNFWMMLVLIAVCATPLTAEAVLPIPTGPINALGQPATPDYYTTANWANSPPMAKFVDTLPGLTAAGANNLGQYISIATPDIVTYPGSDYYEINLVEYRQQMHSDLPLTTGPTTGTMGGTLLRGYVQVNNGTNKAACNPAVTNPAAVGYCTSTHNTVVPSGVHFLGPIIIAERDRPVRIKFTNRLPSGEAGKLFIPTDTSVMGAGSGPAYPVTFRGEVGRPCNSSLEPNTCASYTQNRSDIHLHGGRTPWISDGTPHQWITPVEEITPFTKGVSLKNVPDMPDPGDGSTTYYLTNQQSARLMFYHEHAWGITRLNPYVGVAAGYLITDKWEADLIERRLLPPEPIPLVIQDRTFVDATPVVHPVTGEATTQIRLTDPLWNWGSGALDPATGIRPPVTGDLWMPHVYMPAQTQVPGAGGTNTFGRWMYGPWFYPATVISKGPVANPYYDPNCSSTNPFELADCLTPGQPTQIPGTPDVSMGMEAFQDSALVNGAVFPSVTLEPRAYRFRILNAASDRFWNLNFYKADPAQLSPDPRLNPLDPNYRPGRSNKTEVKMIAASISNAAANNWPPDWPVDGRVGDVPDPGVCTVVAGQYSCENFGPNFLQIGTESGFLPNPVVINHQPITYNTDPTAFWVGNVNKMGLALGPAERADVVVDFSRFAGQTLILYNDAPAAWPAGVGNYDYYTGAPDNRSTGGFGVGGFYDPASGTYIGGTGPLVGYAPNTRTIMQVVIAPAASAGAYQFNETALRNEFTSAAPVVTKIDPVTSAVIPFNPEIPGQRPLTLFERSQEPIVVGQAAYKDAYPASYFPINFPWEGIMQINDQALTFVTLAGEKVVVPAEPKGMHDEMGASFDPIYGRMSGNLGMQLPNPTSLTALLILYGYSDIPTEFVNDSKDVLVQVLPGLPGQPGTVTDGTQIWKISHNGVDTHPIHFHIFDVQLLNRVGWDGQILMPEPNELGWKETIKISPLEDTIIAVRPRAPSLPFGIPNSIRPLNPAIPIDSTMGFGAPVPGVPAAGSNWPIQKNNGTTVSGFVNIDYKTGLPYVFAAGPPPTPYPGYAGVVTNVLYNFGFEYVWHCHILSHEEMDMMRTIVVNYTPALPPAFSASATTGASDVVLNWNDPTPIDYRDITTYGKPENEEGFNIYRTTNGAFPLNAITGKPVPHNRTVILANTTTYTDVAAAPAAGAAANSYVVEAFNAAGSTVSFVGTLFTPTVTTATTGPFSSPGPITLTATTTAPPTGVTITRVEFYDGATLLGSDTTAPYSLVWRNVTAGTHSITAKVFHSFFGGSVVSATLPVVVNSTLTAAFTSNNASGINACANTTFTSTSTGTITGYSWMVNNTTIPFATTTMSALLPIGTSVVTLGVVNGNTGEAAQASQTFTVSNHPPTAIPGGPYFVATGGTLNLLGSGTDPDSCDILTYGWNVDGKAGNEYTIANPVISYKAALAVLGLGTHPAVLTVSDGKGGTATAATTVTVSDLAISTVSPLPRAATTLAYSLTFTKTGGFPGGTVWSLDPATSLPPGLSLNGAAGSISGTPTTLGTFNFKLLVTDSTGAVASKVFALTVVGAPVARDDSATTVVGTPVIINVIANDAALTPAVINPATVVVSSVSGGAAVALANGTVRYTPPARAGTYTIRYTVRDTSVPFKVTNLATVTVTVTAVAPVAVNDAFALSVGSTTLLNVLANDTAPSPTTINPATITVSAVTGGATAIANPNGLISYTAPAVSGIYTFNYTVKDNSVTPVTSNVATVTLTVTTAPVAVPDTATVVASGTITIPVLTNDIAIAPTVINVDSITVSAATGGTATANATGTVTYVAPVTPGTYTFTYTVKNSSIPGVASNSALVTVTVTAVPPVAVADSATVVAGSTVIIPVLTNDTVTAPTVINVATITVTPATAGSATANGNGTVSYTAPATPGTYTFTYTVKDTSTPAVTSNSATVTVTVTKAPPVAVNDAANVVVNNTVIIPVLFNDTVTAPTVINPATVTVTAATGGTASANANGTVSYIAPATPGTYTFTYTVNDTSTPAIPSNSATVTVTVVAPLAISTPSTLPVYTAPYTGYTFAATGGYGAYSWAVSVGPLPPGLSLSTAGVLSGTPTASGVYLFAVQVTDSSTPTAGSVTKLVSMEVVVPPVAANDTVTVVAGGTVIIPVLTNDTATAPATINPASVVVSNITGGNAVPNVNGTVSYTAPATYGTYSFDYTVKDSNVSPVTSNVATVTVVVVAIPAAPVLIGPQGSVSLTPTYTFVAVPNASAYSIYLWDNTNSSGGSTTYAPSAGGCASGTGNCNMVQGTPLISGHVYSWYVYASNATGTSPDGGYKVIYPDSAPTPATPTQISPQGSVSLTPTYTFAAVPNATAYSIYLWDNTTSSGVITPYTPSAGGCASGTGNCNMVQGTPLISGHIYSWFVYASNAAGTSPDGSYLVIFPSTSTVVPATPTQISPQGTVVGLLPTYIFTASPGATSYSIELWDNTSSTGVTTTYLPADGGVACAAGTGNCAIVQATPLIVGHTYSWYITAADAAGSSPFSYLAFTVQ
ncbi:MAG: Ig-like domain-containing protein [Desulfuromonadaceae bacterium]